MINDYNTIKEAAEKWNLSERIDAKSLVFLLEELCKQFISLDYEDGYDMQENLCEKEDQLKVLVLAPANKSADVLVRRIRDWKVLKMENVNGKAF